MAERTSLAGDVAALHLAARRHCTDRHTFWCTRYAQRRGFSSGAYSDEDYREFPRYLVLSAILEEIERWVPDDFESLEEARELLIEAARTASDAMSSTVKHPIGLAAQAEERADVERFLRESTEEAWHAAEPLPFHRTLGSTEADALYERFKRRWGVWYAAGSNLHDLPPNLTLHTEVVSKLPVREALQAFFASHGITRVFLRAETGTSYEIEIIEIELLNGSETSWVPLDCAWMINTSHESSVTFGGAELVTALRAALPTLDDYEYRGWDDVPSQRTR
jgi:hypothetical protein